MSYATIEDLRSQLGSTRLPDAEQRYASKMLHVIPNADVVDRAGFILEHCAGKRVLEFGASGPMHDAIVKAASQVLGVDREASFGVVGFDLDDVSQASLPAYEADVIICGEVLEHLSNPGWFLTRLKRQYPSVPVVITVPNAFSAAAHQHMAKGTENVNRDHTCWYSFRTLKTLLERHGFGGYRFAWYGGCPLTAEGIVVLCGETT